MEFDMLTSSEISLVLKKQNIVTPTEVQKKAIPEILDGKSMVVRAETGSGKTLSYLLSLLMRIQSDEKKPQAVVLTPTHELAIQVHKQAVAITNEIKELSFIEPAVIIGGANMNRQLEKLKKKPRLIIGSTGRLLELVHEKKMTMHFVKTIVLDEADRLLDEANISDVIKLIKTTLRDRQLLLFSASMDKAIPEEFTNLVQELIALDLVRTTRNKIPDSIRHAYVVSEYRDKIKHLRRLIHMEKIRKAVVFVSNPDMRSIDTIVQRLNYHEVSSVGIYGDVKKQERRSAMEAFHTGKARILVASDLAARGLDFKDIDYVLNYDMPEDADIYLHRAGRCGRMGRKGVCVSLISTAHINMVKKMEKKLGIVIEQW